MTKMIFVNLPVADLGASVAFYKALGFSQNLQFSDETCACMVWSDSIHTMLLSHARWRTFTERPIPPQGTCQVMLALSMDSRQAVDRMNEVAAAHGGQAGFMYGRDLSDPDGHLWGPFWMDPAMLEPAAPAA
jgi:uncharacterized protein